MNWKTLLAYITGSVDQELLQRNEYLVTENRILRKQIKGRVQLSDGEGSVSFHATFIFSGIACRLQPLKGGRAHDMPTL
jgi:hypothetical protein